MSTGFRDITTLVLHWWQVSTVHVRAANTIGVSVAMRATSASSAVRPTTASIGIRSVAVTKKTRQ